MNSTSPKCRKRDLRAGWEREVRVEHSNEPACIANHVTERILAYLGQRRFTRKYCWHWTFKNLLCVSESGWSSSRDYQKQSFMDVCTWGALAIRSWKRAFCSFVHGGMDEGGDVIEKYFQKGPEYAAHSSLLNKYKPTRTFCHVTLCIQIYRHVYMQHFPQSVFLVTLGLHRKGKLKKAT